MLGKIDVPGLGSVEIIDQDSFEVAKSFMDYLHKKVNHKIDTKIQETVTPKQNIPKPEEISKNREKTIWTDDEFQYLMSNHGTLTAREIAKHLNRTVNGVKCMGYKNGLTFRRKKRKHGPYKKSKAPDEYKSIKKRILDSPQRLIIEDFLKKYPDVKEDTLTTVLSRMIKSGIVRQEKPGVVIHG